MYQLQPGHSPVEGGKRKADYIGESTDTKPTVFTSPIIQGGVQKEEPLATGSMCYEADTQNAFVYSEKRADAGQDPWIIQ